LKVKEKEWMDKGAFREAPENIERKEVINMDQPKPPVQPKPMDQPKPPVQPKPMDQPKPPVQPKPIEKPKY
jgi:hypothetical protein